MHWDQPDEDSATPQAHVCYGSDSPLGDCAAAERFPRVCKFRSRLSCYFCGAPKLTDFKIDPPSLLAIPTKDEMPVRVEMTWRTM